ncbi:hypothetical protein [Kocuria rosea]|uniref:hypothetical protein n=1 Tax=Kocuria rosea TaxID=1275 RepID=UPI00204204DD|nr:hypothetical protein [Kocuria rosea]MCM3687096.1 hypothetical protein [Kocuria rosea]
MTTPDPGALAVELRPHGPTHWIATYYPLVDTPAGRWADVTWTLHQHLIPTPKEAPASARWLDLRSPDPGHPGYAAHQVWATQLAAGYATALAVHRAEVPEEPLSHDEAQQLRAGTVVVPAGQLSEWVLDDLEVGTPGLYG